MFWSTEICQNPASHLAYNSFFRTFVKPFTRVVRKFFAHDKNYLLEETQLRTQDYLLTKLIDSAVEAYQRINNPLSLNDVFSEKIASYYPKDLRPLYPFYQNMAGIYRFKFGENQLEFLWDGKDHTQKYLEDWTQTFQQWTRLLCRQIQFVQAVLDLTVFLPDAPHIQMSENRMNAVMLGLFELKIHKQKGIVEMKVA